MNSSSNPLSLSRLLAALGCLSLLCAVPLLIWRSATPLQAQETQVAATNSAAAATPSPASPAPAPANPPPAQPASTSQAAVPVAATAAVQASPSAAPASAIQTTNSLSALLPPTNAPGATPGSTNAAAADKGGPADGIELSFQGASIDMVIQWLAQTTGKSVMKKNQVQAQLTIVSSKKLPQREALNLVYNALSLEGFSVIETPKSIFIVPEGQEPKLNPVLIDDTRSDIPEGRQRLVKIFQLKHSAPADLKDKIRPVLSEKAAIDTDDRSSSLIVTDYNDNLRLLEKLIKDLDVASISDSVVEIYNLKHAEAEELGNLITMVLTASGPPPSAPAMPGMPGMPGMPQQMNGGRRIIMNGMPMGQPNMGQPNMGQPGAPGGQPAGGEAGGVHIWPDKVSNRLIVLAPKSKLPEVKRLIDILDTDKPEDVAVRVLPLKHVNATDLVRDIQPLYEKLSGKSIKDMIEVSANDRANSLIVLSSESNYRSILKLVESLDTDDATEKVVETFVLKNADAEDVAKQLQDLNKDNNGNTRYVYYFDGNGGGSKANKKLSVVADRRRNTLLVQAPPSMMEGVAKMIKSLDEPVTDDSLAPKIYPLKYVNAVDIEDVLNELFLKKTQQRNYYDYFFNDDQESSTPDKNVGRLYGKVRITSEPYSNAIIVTANSAENLAAVEEVLKKLDVPSEAGETTFRVRLRFAKAGPVANSLNILFAKNGSPPLRAPNQQPNQPQQPQPQPNQQGQSQNSSFQNSFGLSEETKEEGYFPWLGGQPDNNARGGDGRSTTRPVSDLVGKVRVVPDLPSNSLMISANVHFFPEVAKLLEALDAPTPQVMIEARIIEVSSDFLHQLGVRWGPNGNAYSADDLDNGINPSISTTYVAGFAGKSATAAAIANALRAGTLNASLNMDFLIQFLRKNTDATVLAEPQINIADNEIGRLFVGSKVPIATSTLTPAVGGSTAGYDYKDVGVILEVTPHINDEGQVALKIHAESATLETGAGVGGDPIIDTRQFQTELVAKNGQTLVLGGIRQKQMNSVMRKTPFLANIPGFGWAFKKSDKNTQEVELLVFLRPRITRTPAEAKELLEETDKKNPLIRPWRGDVLPNLLNDKDKHKDKPSSQ